MYSTVYFNCKVELIVIDQKNGERKHFHNYAVLVNEKGHLMLSDLIAELKKQDMGFLDRAIISILNPAETHEQANVTGTAPLSVYTYCGNDPLPDNFSVAVDLTQPVHLYLHTL